MRKALFSILVFILFPIAGSAQQFVFTLSSGSPAGEGGLMSVDRLNGSIEKLLDFNGENKVFFMSVTELDSANLTGIAVHHSEGTFIYRLHTASGKLEFVHRLSVNADYSYGRESVMIAPRKVLSTHFFSGYLFTYDFDLDKFEIVFTFSQATGFQPTGELEFDAATGIVYGLTSDGGSLFRGLLFSYHTGTKKCQVETEFGGDEGSQATRLAYSDTHGLIGSVEDPTQQKGFFFRYTPAGGYSIIKHLTVQTGLAAGKPGIRNGRLYWVNKASQAQRIFSMSLDDTLDIVSMPISFPYSPSSLNSSSETLVPSDSVAVFYSATGGKYMSGALLRADFRTGQLTELFAFNASTGTQVDYMCSPEKNRRFYMRTRSLGPGQSGTLLKFDSLMNPLASFEFDKIPWGFGIGHTLVKMENKNIYLLQTVGGTYGKGLIIKTSYPGMVSSVAYTFGSPSTTDSSPVSPSAPSLVKVNDTLFAFMAYQQATASHILCYYSTRQEKIILEQNLTEQNLWPAAVSLWSCDGLVYGWALTATFSTPHLYQSDFLNNSIDTLFGNIEPNGMIRPGTVVKIGTEIFGIATVFSPDSMHISVYGFDTKSGRYRTMGKFPHSFTQQILGIALLPQGQMAITIHGGVVEPDQIVIFRLEDQSYEAFPLPPSIGRSFSREAILIPEYNALAVLCANNAQGQFEGSIVLFSPNSHEFEKVANLADGVPPSSIFVGQMIFMAPDGYEPNIMPHIRVYPNPSEGRFRVKDMSFPVEYALYTTDGRLVQKGIVKDETQEIIADVNSTEMYFLKLSNAETTHTVRVMLKR